MKSFVLALSILLFSMVLLVSCKGRKPLEPEKITEAKYIKEIIRDTILEVQADSTFYSAWIECVNGKPVLREPEPRKATINSIHKETQKALQKPKVQLDENGKLSVECSKEMERIKAQLKDKYESLLSKRQTPVYIEKKLSLYQKTLMWLGGIFLLLIAISIIIKIKN